MKIYRLTVSFDFACEESEVKCVGVENFKETVFLSELSKMRYRPTKKCYLVDLSNRKDFAWTDVTYKM
jgi:hypothetical protein